MGLDPAQRRPIDQRRCRVAGHPGPWTRRAGPASPRAFSQAQECDHAWISPDLPPQYSSPDQTESTPKRATAHLPCPACGLVRRTAQGWLAAQLGPPPNSWAACADTPEWGELLLRPKQDIDQEPSQQINSKVDSSGPSPTPRKAYPKSVDKMTHHLRRAHPAPQCRCIRSETLRTLLDSLYCRRIEQGPQRGLPRCRELRFQRHVSLRTL
jgi:hypothetical protein